MESQVISYQVIKEIIQNHKRILLYLMGGILIIFLLLAFLLPKKYTSSVMIQVKPQSGSLNTMINNTALLSLAGISTGGSVLDYMSLLKSDRVINPVIKKLDNEDAEDERFTAEDFVKKYMQIDNPRGTSIFYDYSRFTRKCTTNSTRCSGFIARYYSWSRFYSRFYVD